MILVRWRRVERKNDGSTAGALRLWHLGAAELFSAAVGTDWDRVQAFMQYAMTVTYCSSIKISVLVEYPPKNFKK